MPPSENVGYLSYSQFDRFRWAVHNSRNLVPWLRIAGYIRGGDVDELKHRTSDRPLGLPPTWIAAEEISRLSNELNPYPELEDAAHDQYGAWIAWEFTREVETASHKWPYEDRPHNVRYLGCPACEAPALRYAPPQHGGGQVEVKCRACFTVIDEQLFATLARRAEIEHEQRRLGERERGPRGGAQIAADNPPVGAAGEGANYPPDAGSVPLSA